MFEDKGIKRNGFPNYEDSPGHHQQGDVRYGISRVKQISCMPLISFSWTLLKSPGPWDKFDLDCISGEGGQLFVFKVI